MKSNPGLPLFRLEPSNCVLSIRNPAGLVPEVFIILNTHPFHSRYQSGKEFHRRASSIRWHCAAGVAGVFLPAFLSHGFWPCAALSGVIFASESLLISQGPAEAGLVTLPPALLPRSGAQPCRRLSYHPCPLPPRLPPGCDGIPTAHRKQDLL